MISSGISNHCRHTTATGSRYCIHNNNTNGGRFMWVTKNNTVGVTSPPTTVTTTRVPSSGPPSMTTSMRWKSTSSYTTTSYNASKHQQQLTYQEYMNEANNVMHQYHRTRELMKQGKLVSKNGMNGSSNRSSYTVHIQAGVAAVFVVVFLSMPMLGKRIATDEEFRKKYVPKWYDFTVPKPEKPWTRQELHEQMIEVQRTLHERAIAGDFTPDKIQQMKITGTLSTTDKTASGTVQSPRSLEISFDHFYPHRKTASCNSTKGTSNAIAQKDWDKVHPGLAVDEKVAE